MATKIHLTFFIFALIGCIKTSSVISATLHLVGDAAGWHIPAYPTFFSDWAKKRTFRVGDTLQFPYNRGLNSVVQVDKQDFQFCTMKNYVKQYYDGNTNITLHKPGDYYFFCSVGKHCEIGQKLHITVS